MKTNLIGLFAAAAAVAALAGCGGSASSPAPSSVTPTAPAPAPAPTPAAPPPALAAVATLPPGTSPPVGAADCANLQAATVSAPTVVGADMQAASDVLAVVDPAHGYSALARLPSTLIWWLRAAGSEVDEITLGAAVHETNHKIDFALRYACHTDGLARYFADGQTHFTGLAVGSTSNYSIVAEAYPAALKSPRALRFDLYVAGAAAANSNDFSVLLEELNAYAGGANFEVNLLSNSAYSYLSKSGDFNLGGMTDFMLFLQSYISSARLSHPASYASIQSSSQTLSFIQFAWTRAERILIAAYPYSTASGGTQVVPVDVIAQIYSAPFLSELDRLGITHKVAADWSTTYLR